ncbi:dTMP kinase [Acidianus brierleyi]|uniref:Probable thymidylate kinase n=1 Tax=Acidianus brierleyi TaxID=41673 RepID=A0A2U9IF11_9CREN|nr:dTMP kinase [Acidianus brierleyi]AWR94590.1 dTMP kinase [Acidianus brierleyi]
MLLIALEGIDGAGKTTVAKKLFEKLHNKNVIITAEPFTQDIIKMIEDNGWKNPIILTLLFAADRAIHINWIYNQHPDIVILDRYIYSSIAYQSVMGIDEEWIREVNSKFPKPTITFLIDVPIEIAIQRINKNDKFNFEEKIKLLHNVRNKYLEIAKKDKLIIVNGQNNIETITTEIFNVVEKYLKSS